MISKIVSLIKKPTLDWVLRISQSRVVEYPSLQWRYSKMNQPVLPLITWYHYLPNRPSFSSNRDRSLLEYQSGASTKTSPFLVSIMSVFILMTWSTNHTRAIPLAHTEDPIRTLQPKTLRTDQASRINSHAFYFCMTLQPLHLPLEHRPRFLSPESRPRK